MNAIKTIKRLAVLGGLACMVTVGTLQMFAAPAAQFEAAVWVDGELYDVNQTSAFFKSPPAKSTDVIFAFFDLTLGQRSVAEAGPGDSDYNGGRWQVMAVNFTAEGLAIVDPDGDGAVNVELMSAEEVLAYAAAGYVTIVDTGIRFECPLRPRRGSP
jgi:hypothetical protein